MSTALRVLLALLMAVGSGGARAEDGYDLWLRYRPLPATLRPAALPTSIVAGGADPSIAVAVDELVRGLSGLLGSAVPRASSPSDGAILIGTSATDKRVAAMDLTGLGPEGYRIRTSVIEGRPVTVIGANSGAGALYGAFHYLRLVQTGAPVARLDIASSPKLRLRLLNHWDNLDRHVERGYAGQSIWDWWKLPDILDRRYVDYARANASIGINGTVLNNVNAKADSLTAPYIAKAAALAGVFRPYGIKVYLSARFSAPIEIGGLKTADPLDPAVRAWWKAKADELYAAIPDFGGFLVKADSEGQPGPQDYGRSHADGANMLAEAVRPHGGIVMWRAFVYSHEVPDDRAKQAYTEFKPLDGAFADNVIVQVKNGPIDFQPREPFHPLFGAMPRTPLTPEFQITKEYLGFSTHLAYLGPLLEETLQSDTNGKGLTVARVVAGQRRTGIAGVANIGSDRDWSGSDFDQANWYAFGRYAWDPESRAADVAADWLRMTFSADPRFVEPALAMMMGSRQAVVDYMTPLGLHHVMATGHHYGPGPWVDDAGRPDWNPVYYHRADTAGIGFDRTASGSNAVAQYAAPVARRFASLKTVPEDNLLWFHHVRWDQRMKSGRTLWGELVTRYSRGVGTVAAMRATWSRLAPYVDAERHAAVSASLAVQEREARWWRDASIAYFRTFASRPLPPGEPEPAHSLQYYKALRFPYAPGN